MMLGINKLEYLRVRGPAYPRGKNLKS